MARSISPLNIVTICASGLRARRATRNASRIRLLETTTQAIIESSWKDIHAIVLPGGHFFHTSFIGHLPYAERKTSLEASTFHDAIMRSVERLQELYPNITIICGIDSKSRDADEGGDECCVAWNHTGIIGIGRKVFPSNGDTNQKYHYHVIRVYGDDFGTKHRVVTLSSGHRAVLCACYDMFGIKERASIYSPRHHYIRYLYHNGKLHTHKDKKIKQLSHYYITQWQAVLKAERVNIGISTIHDFNWPNADCFWQRHGIATASAGLGGGLAIAAAHFRDYVPDPHEATLAAFNVPQSHIDAGLNRKALRYPCSDALDDVECGKESAAIRLFSVEQ